MTKETPSCSALGFEGVRRFNRFVIRSRKPRPEYLKSFTVVDAR
jgi:hypothetical protein